MQLALTSQALGTQPLDEDIRVAAVSGFPWLVLDQEKLERYLATPEFDIRDLKRIFLRTQPAAIDGVLLPDADPSHTAQIEARCKEARRIGAPVLVLRIDQPDERITALAEVAKQWSTVLALAPAMEGSSPSFSTIREVVQQVNHPNLGWVVDILALWQSGEHLTEEDAARTVLLTVGDLSAEGRPALPGEGVVPLRELLRPLRAGGFDSIAVLASRMAEAHSSVEAWARTGHDALSELLTQAGWMVDS